MRTVFDKPKLYNNHDNPFINVHPKFAILSAGSGSEDVKIEIYIMH